MTARAKPISIFTPHEGTTGALAAVGALDAAVRVTRSMADPRAVHEPCAQVAVAR